MLDLDKSSWKTHRFADIAANVKERTDDPAASGMDRYVGLEHLDPGSMTINRWGSPEEVSATKLVFQPGDVVFARRRAYQKKLGQADFTGIASAHALVLRAIPDVITERFLPVFLSSDYFLNRAISISVGSLSPTVNWRDLSVQEFTLPGLDEQERIADLLWALERCAVSTERVRQAVHNTALAFCDKWWREGAADLVELGEIGHCVTGSTPRTNIPNFWSPQEIPFITPGDFVAPTISTSARHVSSQGAESVRPVPKNSVGVVCIGATLGKVARFGVSCTTNQQITSLVGLDEADASLLVALLASPSGQVALNQRAGSTTLPQLNRSSFQKVRVPWPEATTRNAWSTRMRSITAAREVTEMTRIHEVPLRRGLLEVISEVRGDVH